MNKDILLEWLDKATALELNEVVKAIEEKFGVSAAAVAAAPAAGAAGAEAVEEILANPEQIARVTTTAKKLVSENYDWDVIASDENKPRCARATHQNNQQAVDRTILYLAHTPSQNVWAITHINRF